MSEGGDGSQRSPFTRSRFTPEQQSRVSPLSRQEIRRAPERIKNYSLNPDKPRDLSMITRGEDFVDELKPLLSGLSVEQLSEIVDDATTDWINFNPIRFGFKLPAELSLRGRNGPGQLIDIKEAISPVYTFVSNVAVELCLKRLEQATHMDNRHDYGEEQHTADAVKARKIEELAKFREMIGTLFNWNIRQYVSSVTEQNLPSKFNNDVHIQDLLLGPTQLYKSPKYEPRHFRYSPETLKTVLNAVRENITKPGYMARFDVFIARHDKQGVLSEDFRPVSRYGSYAEPWLKRMQKFAELNRKFDDSNPGDKDAVDRISSSEGD